MKIRVMCIIVAASFVAASCSWADTVFTDSNGNQDFHDPGNWDNGLPTNTLGVIGSGLTAVVTNDFTGTGGLDVAANNDTGTLTVEAGELTIDGANTTIGYKAGSHGILNVYEGAQLRSIDKGFGAGRGSAVAEVNIAGSLVSVKDVTLENVVLDVESTATNMMDSQKAMTLYPAVQLRRS